MKKALLLLCIVAGLMSCAKENLNSEKDNKQNEGVPMTFNFTVLETKAAKTAWADGDKIYVFFKGLATKYLILERSGSSWINTSGGGTLEDTDFSGLATKELTAVHFPVAVDVTYADSKFSFTSGGKLVYNYYLFDTNKDYTVSGTTVTATLSMGKPANMVQIHVAGIQANVANYFFGCSKIKPVACASVGINGTITESERDAGFFVRGMSDSDGGIFAGRLVYPGTAEDYQFDLASNAKAYTLTRSNRILTAGKMYNFPAPSETGGSNWTEIQDIVNLGTEAVIYNSDKSKVVGKEIIYWAKCNLGATTETGYGDYYAWGELEPHYSSLSPLAWKTGKEGYFQYKYQWKQPSGPPYFPYTKYNKSDKKETLLPEDDAAHVALGGRFRMPTSAEFATLQALTRSWSDDYNGSGIKGYVITGNSKTIFLPGAGYMTGTYAPSRNNNNTDIHYWTSTRGYADETYDHSERAFEGEHTFNTGCERGRYLGQSIRPVYVVEVAE